MAARNVMDIPGTLVAVTVGAYWFGVGAMIVRVRRQSRKHAARAADVLPRQPVEQVLGLIWVPLVAAWIALPWLALSRVLPPFGLPAFTLAPAYAVLRHGAAAVAIVCLALTVKSWVRMGRHWRMAVTDDEQTLITDGTFTRVRHPIYALSILLMACTMVVVPTVLMVTIGAMHIVLMVIKARIEERHLLVKHGTSYAAYVRRTGRFLPRSRCSDEGAGPVR